MRQVSRYLLSHCLLLLFVGMLWANAAAAATLKDVSANTLPGGRLELRLNFSGGVPQPKIFTTSNPPRIAIDFANTDSTAQRRTNLNQGTATGITTVAAGGRTRVLVDLVRESTFHSRVEGNALVLTINNGNEAGNISTATIIDPSKALPSAMTGTNVSNIDFRRGPNGEGRVLINFDGPGGNADMHRQGDKLLVTIDHANLPPKLAQRLDVLDFATPVQTIVTRAGNGGGAHMEIAIKGNVDTSSYQTGNQYVVEVSPKKQTPEEAAKLAKSQEPVYSGNRVTFNFQDIPVRSALQLLADISGLNLVASDSVSGSVTLRLVNVPWDQALDVVLRAKGLDKRRNGNVIWIAPQKELADYEQSVATARLKADDNAELVTDYVPISYGKAKDIAKLLTTGSMSGTGGGSGGGGGGITTGFLSSRGSVSYDERTNTLLINDNPEKIRQLREMIAVLDKPVQQVLIESRVVIATDDFTRELGAKFGINANRINPSGQTISVGGGLVSSATATGSTATGTSNSISSITGTNLLNVNLPPTTAGGGIALSLLGKNYALDLELDASQTEGRSEVISSPRVITANQQEAVIRQGQEIGYVTYQNSTSSAPGAGTATVQFKDAVLELKVTPTITADSRIYLAINVKKDALDHYQDVPGSGSVPVINTQEVNTSVLVDNGQTVVLGGIYEVTKNNAAVKVPGLGDIPGIGALFRHTTRTNDKGELLIFVTPRILSDTLQ